MYTLYKFLSRLLFPLVHRDSRSNSLFKVWFHAASVGEVVAASPLIKKYLSMEDSGRVLLTVMTGTGVRKASSLFKERVIIRKFPLDVPQKIRDSLREGEPKALILIETELWPNLILESSRMGVPIILVNGRMGEKSFRAYRMLRPEIGPLLKRFSLFLLQTETDRERFLALGAPEERVKVTGSLKYDVEMDNEAGISRGEFGYEEDDFVIVFGSVRSREEDEVIEAISLIFGKDNFQFILAPRHLLRVGPIRNKLRKRGIPFVERTREGKARGRVLILDTVGELVGFYSIADVAFVGGTLAPYGGHNLLEPAALGIPVLFGPYTFSTEDAAEGLVIHSGGIRVRDSKELRSTILRLYQDRELREKIGKSAKGFLLSRRGVTERVFNEIRPFLFQRIKTF